MIYLKMMQQSWNFFAIICLVKTKQISSFHLSNNVTFDVVKGYKH